MDGSLGLEELIDLITERDLFESLDEPLLDRVVAEVEGLEVSCLPQCSEEGGVAIDVRECCERSARAIQAERGTHQAFRKSERETLWEEEKRRK